MFRTPNDKKNFVLVEKCCAIQWKFPNGSVCYAGHEDMFGKSSNDHFHFVPFPKNTQLARLYLWQAALEGKCYGLWTEIRFESIEGKILSWIVTGFQFKGFQDNEWIMNCVLLLILWHISGSSYLYLTWILIIPFIRWIDFREIE